MPKINERRPLDRVLDLSGAHPSRLDFLRTFADQLRLQGRSRTAIQARRTAVAWFLSSVGKEPHEVTQELAVQFFNDRHAAGTAIQRLTGIKEALQEAFDEMCNHVIAGPIQLPKPLEKIARTAPAPSPQAEPTQSPTPTPTISTPSGRSPRQSRAQRRRKRREKLIRVLSREVGLRANEIADLRWPNIDFGAGIVILKAPNATRRILMTTRAREVLARAFQRAHEPEGYLLCRSKGEGPITLRTVQRALHPPKLSQGSSALNVSRSPRQNDLERREPRQPTITIPSTSLEATTPQASIASGTAPRGPGHRQKRQDACPKGGPRSLRLITAPGEDPEKISGPKPEASDTQRASVIALRATKAKDREP